MTSQKFSIFKPPLAKSWLFSCTTHKYGLSQAPKPKDALRAISRRLWMNTHHVFGLLTFQEWKHNLKVRYSVFQCRL